ncbi:CPBP family intramembrane glutamic endopeptidase [Roseitranquillus sediminis]|uniref:CPBP family intramembrane glutamic endopeptidase n=1 Tax=Roseitranquillus sediminis TaxID=2809051 RepID=UPI001D0C344A|nr:CPBP family intramembrane glutamic endopeptidase [Roseitranquillus sediminis]MBM9593208.1 CPBP family intramembrane metalloprotease [Roseitranquillus sediminis]
MHRPAFEAFVAPARRQPQLWRLLLGFVAMLAVYALSLAGFFGGLAFLHGRERALELASRLVEPDAPALALLLLATFAGMAAAPVVVARVLHGRGAGTLFGRAPRVLRDFVGAAAVVFAFYGLMIGLWALLHDARPNLAPERWLALLPLTVLGLIVQTGAEELIFRGYLTQQLAARFRTPLAWMLLPALLFGVAHYDPTVSGATALILIGGATLFGLAAADLTAVTGSLGAAWGFHFANNFVAIALLATEGTITGLSLYTTPYGIDTGGPVVWLLVADLALIVLAWALCRTVLRR